VTTAARIPVLLNAAAGRRAISAARLQRQLGDIALVHAVDPADIEATVAGVIRDGTPIVGIAGGDGTMHAAAGALAGSGAALAAVPTGTLNHFARRLGVPTIALAAQAMREGRVQPLPVGVVNGRVFLNTLTFGEYSRIVRLRELHRPRLGKWPAAVLAFGMSLFSMRRFNVTLTVAGHTFTRRTPFVWVGVGWGSFPRVHEAQERRAQPDLEVAILRSDTPWAALAFVLRLGIRMALRRTPVRDGALEILHTRSLVIDAERQLDVTADGEVLKMTPPARIIVEDAALNVLVGPATDAEAPVT
jgi:diacylglycerol kinase family enzyme